MTIDIRAMLDRVIADVFHGDFVTVDVRSDDPTWVHGVQVSSRAHENRAAIIRAGFVWMDAFIPELNVQAAILDEDDVEADKEAELRKLCRALRAYLKGGGNVTTRRRLFGRGSTFVLTVEADGFEWRLGQNVWAGPRRV